MGEGGRETKEQVSMAVKRGGGARERERERVAAHKINKVFIMPLNPVTPVP